MRPSIFWQRFLKTFSFDFLILNLSLSLLISSLYFLTFSFYLCLFFLSLYSFSCFFLSLSILFAVTSFYFLFVIIFHLANFNIFDYSFIKSIHFLLCLYFSSLLLFIFLGSLFFFPFITNYSISVLVFISSPLSFFSSSLIVSLIFSFYFHRCHSSRFQSISVLTFSVFCLCCCYLSFLITYVFIMFHFCLSLVFSKLAFTFISAY